MRLWGAQTHEINAKRTGDWRDIKTSAISVRCVFSKFRPAVDKLTQKSNRLGRAYIRLRRHQIRMHTIITPSSYRSGQIFVQSVRSLFTHNKPNWWLLSAITDSPWKHTRQLYVVTSRQYCLPQQQSNRAVCASVCYCTAVESNVAYRLASDCLSLSVCSYVSFCCLDWRTNERICHSLWSAAASLE